MNSKIVLSTLAMASIALAPGMAAPALAQAPTYLGQWGTRGDG